MTAGDEYRKAERLVNGSDPIEAGLVGNLVDHECEHGRLPSDPARRCGCWPEEGVTLAVVNGHRQPLSPQVARELRGLRRAGLSYGAISVVVNRYFHTSLTYEQVAYYLRKAGVVAPKIDKGRVVA